MDEVGVQSKHRARQFVTKLWVSDCKGNFHLATCLCDNGSEVNLQSNSFLPDDCVFESPHPVTLEGVSGHSLAGGQRGCYISTHLVAHGVSRDRQTWKRVLILSCRFLADGFENRVEITKFVDNFILFQENSNN